MMNKKKGQVVVSLISFILATIIYILASPIVYEIIVESVGEFGTATAFVVKLFLWFIFLILIAYFLKIINSGEGFFVS